MIPKIFHSYWDGSPLSFLQYLTVKTFQDLNPDWEINLYIPKYRFNSFPESTLDSIRPFSILMNVMKYRELNPEGNRGGFIYHKSHITSYTVNLHSHSFP